MSKSLALLLSGTAAVALLPANALAQTESAPSTIAASPDQAGAPEPADIVVTGSHIERRGFESPTPVTVLGTDFLQAQPRANLTDTINLLPQFVNSQTSSVAATGATNLQGQNLVNLRNLGANRTLVLIDGHRAPMTNLDGTVDLNVNLPNQLVQRTEIVTGGASAVYGSDAVAGVVNFVLDKDFTGIKGALEQGITIYGDDPSFKANLSLGTKFAGGRGHILLSGEYAREAGIDGVPRDWNAEGWRLISNPSYVAGNGLPQYLIQNHTGLQNATPGGIITSGPLKGTAFGQGGTPYKFNYGTAAGSTVMVGGDWATNNLNDTQQLWVSSRRKNVFGRVSYDITDGITGYVQFGYSDSTTSDSQTQQFNLGNITVKSDNAFIPASVKAQMTALGLSSFTLGTYNMDLPPTKAVNRNQVFNYAAGLDGKFGGGWSWSLYGAYGKTISDTLETTSINARFNQAIDSVRDASGKIVCRSTLTNPNDGCVPYNIMGTGVNSPEAVAYVMAESPLHQVLIDREVNADLRGRPFSTWAGPASIALGGAYPSSASRARRARPRSRRVILREISFRPTAAMTSRRAISKPPFRSPRIRCGRNRSN